MQYQQRKKNIVGYFVDRSDHLLFARFTNKEAYFLKSYPHKEKTLWSKRELIKIIRDNWPESIADKQIPGLVYPDFNDEEIFSLRKKEYLFGVNVDGQGYVMLGHGQATSGDNMMSGYLADNVVRWIGNNLSLFDTDREMFTNQLKHAMQLL